MSRARPSRVNTAVERDTELALVERLRQGDPDAFDDVYAAFNARLLTFLVRLSRRRDVAEDLLEETWLRLVKHARRLRADTRLGPWLFTVARNLHISYNRSRMLEDSAAASLIALWPFSVERSSPFEAAAASELERRIERALAAMPTTSRKCCYSWAWLVWIPRTRLTSAALRRRRSASACIGRVRRCRRCSSEMQRPRLRRWEE